MSQSKQDDQYHQLVDFLRDCYLSLTGTARQRNLTAAELVILDRTTELLAEFTMGNDALAQEIEKRLS